MKIIYYLMLLVAMTWIADVSAQGKEVSPIPTYYTEILNDAHGFSPSVLKVETPTESSNSSKSMDYTTYAESIRIIRDESRSQTDIPYVIKMQVPFKNHTYNLIFKRKFLRSQDYQLTLSRPERTEHLGVYYQGVIEGEYKGWATLAIIDGKYKLLIGSKNGNIEITHENDNAYYIYEAKDLKEKEQYICQSKDDAQKKNNVNGSGERIGSDCVELYIECDFQSYLDNGSSSSATEAWALSIMNDVATIYNTIGVPLVVAEVFVWNNSDPYSSEQSTQAVRDSFVEQVKSNYTGRIANLFSTRDMNGGLAYGIGGLCGNYPDFPGPYSISSSMATNYDPYPNYSFTVNVVAHELGHVFGAQHTHACVWGSEFDAQIDDCGNVYASNNGGTPEGTGCYEVDNPILPNNGGTIMSFCNLEGGGIDLANGFATEVGDLISNFYLSAPCATGGACASLPPSNDACGNAKTILANGICSYFEYDNINSSASGVSAPSCGSIGSGNDVWFSFEASFEDMTLNFNPGSVQNVIVTLYSGTCGALIEESCEEVFNEEAFIKLNGLTVNDTYYIRLIEENTNTEGDFELCLVDEFLPCHPAINVLIDLYNSAGGASWTDKTGWQAGQAGTDCDPCSWYGVTCDNLLNVIGIDLFNNNLIGTVPNALGELNRLRTLKLMNNDLSGTFPDIWTDMVDMEFVDLSNNEFTGSMPASLGNMLKLNTLYIENNMMDGALLSEIGDLPVIDVYWVKNNNFEGCYPASYQNLCDIGSTKFTGNPLLPEGGNSFDEFCSQGFGGDADLDGFCFGEGIGDDCIDDDETVYPNAPELCDGKDNDCDGDFDEELVATNTWTAAGGGNWDDPNSWSLGVIPAGCMDVVFPATSNRIVTLGNGLEGMARSVVIGAGNTIVSDGSLLISGSDDNGLIIADGGTFTNNGTLLIENISVIGIEHDGAIINNGTITVSNLGVDQEVRILTNGSILNNDMIFIRD